MFQKTQTPELAVPQLVKKNGEYFIPWFSNEGGSKNKVNFRVLNPQHLLNYDDPNIMSKLEIIGINTAAKMAMYINSDCLLCVHEPNEILAQYIINGENPVSGFLVIKAVSEFSKTPIRSKAFLNNEKLEKMIKDGLPTKVDSY